METTFLWQLAILNSKILKTINWHVKTDFNQTLANISAAQKSSCFVCWVNASGSFNFSLPVSQAKRRMFNGRGPSQTLLNQEQILYLF